ncbi:hypothetical protein C0J52_10249 [Blattella germanica]|nr:hypothetical protein C0J52_10249 [Blattella germanica]
MFEKYNLTDNAGNILDDPTVMTVVAENSDFSESVIKKSFEVCRKISKKKMESEKIHSVCNRMAMHYILCAYDVKNWVSGST